MPDWTEWLTEDERRWLPSVWCRVRTSPACGECLGCASVLAFRTIAALRALVEEKDRALTEAHHAVKETAKALIVVMPKLKEPYPDHPTLSPWTRFFDRHEGTPWGLLNKNALLIRSALALTEADMLKRLEEK